MLRTHVLSTYLRNALCTLLLVAATACGGDTKAVPEPEPVITTARVTISLGRTQASIGETSTIAVVVYDQHDQVRTGREVALISTVPSVATISGNTATAVAPGTTTIRAIADGVAAEATLTVIGVQDVAILDATFTQRVQASDGAVPMISDGLPVVVNVRLRQRTTPVAAQNIVFRLRDAQDAIVHTESKAISGLIGPSSPSNPSLQFLVPASHVTTGLRWEIVRDPEGQAPDDSAANDRLPRDVAAPFPVTAAPLLQVHLVPVQLANHGGAMGTVSQANIDEYMRTVHSVLPVGRVEVSIGNIFVTQQSFGVAPAGGNANFWIPLLSELDAARLSSVQHMAKHWIGLVMPPPGFNFTNFGGFGYVPTDANSIGTGTRTSTVVSLGWFSNPTRTRELVAHELGHNFGRQHTPCGAPANPDPLYPLSSGTIGDVGFDVYSWSTGFAGSAGAVGANTGDIMGYCTPAWASVYTYRGIMNFRATIANPHVQRDVLSTTSEQLVVRGTIDAQRVSLWPVHTLVMPEQPSIDGPYRLELHGANGEVLASRRFRTNAVDHATIETFLVTIPRRDVTADVALLRVVGPHGVTDLRADAVQSARGATSGSSGQGAACDAATREVAVQDGSGEVRGFLSSTSVRLPMGERDLFSISCSNGAQSYRTTLLRSR